MIVCLWRMRLVCPTCEECCWRQERGSSNTVLAVQHLKSFQKLWKFKNIQTCWKYQGERGYSREHFGKLPQPLKTKSSITENKILNHWNQNHKSVKASLTESSLTELSLTESYNKIIALNDFFTIYNYSGTKLLSKGYNFFMSWFFHFYKSTKSPLRISL